MGTNEKGQLFSWSWDWPDWRLPEPILNRIGIGDRNPNNAEQSQNDLAWGNDEEGSVLDINLADLTIVADELIHLIQPALPDPVFRAGLKVALLTAHEQDTPWYIGFRMRSDTPLQPWQVIATVPVLVGVAAVIWLYRQRTEAQPSEAA